MDGYKNIHVVAKFCIIIPFVVQTILMILSYTSGFNFLDDRRAYTAILFFSLLEIICALVVPRCVPPVNKTENNCLTVIVWIFCPVFGILKWLPAWYLLLGFKLEPFTIMTFLLNLPLSAFMLIEVIIFTFKRGTESHN